MGLKGDVGVESPVSFSLQSVGCPAGVHAWAEKLQWAAHHELHTCHPALCDLRLLELGDQSLA